MKPTLGWSHAPQEALIPEGVTQDVGTVRITKVLVRAEPKAQLHKSWDSSLVLFQNVILSKTPKMKIS